MRRVFMMLILSIPYFSYAGEAVLTKGKHSITCECILATSGCSLSLLHKDAGSPLYTWKKDVFVSENSKKVDLDMACYRKRNIDNQGAGLCCETTSQSDGDIKKIFRGSVFR